MERGTTGAFCGLKEMAGGLILSFWEQPANVRAANTAKGPSTKIQCSMCLF